MPTVSTDPLILTLTPDPVAQTWFDELRATHFPPERNWLKAHLTLFHHLPPDQEQIFSDLQQVAEDMAVLTLRATGVIHLGGGVAVKIENDRMTEMQKTLQSRWKPWLTAQDRQTRRFHITIQNKVTAEKATALLRQLAADFTPFEFSATGLSLWIYKNGPWESYRHFPFRSE